MSHGKQFTLYTNVGGPNGWKVAFVLEELGLTYESIYLDLNAGEHKKPEFTKYNPNGRIPVLIDHENSDFVLWESVAILLYLVDKYDTEKKLTVTDDSEKYKLIQWLFFQSSGQGPYFGQYFWFRDHHHEKVPSAHERYRNEIARVWGVLESVLSKQDWLVGGKLTVADMALIVWNESANNALQGEGLSLDQFPAVLAWHKKLMARDAVKKTYAIRKALQV